jgi:hypothetical protein
MKTKILVGFLLLTSFLVSLHQYVCYQVWFDIGDVHHEGIILFLVGFAIGIFLRGKQK